MNLSVDKASADTTTPAFAHETPAHQIILRSQLDISSALECNLVGRFSDGLPTQRIEPYVTCDFQIVWHTAPNLTLVLAGRNLLQATHTEFISTAASTLPASVEREVYGSVRWAF